MKASLESGAGSSPGERRNLKGVAVGRKEKGDERGIPKKRLAFKLCDEIVWSSCWRGVGRWCPELIVSMTVMGTDLCSYPYGFPVSAV